MNRSKEYPTRKTLFEFAQLCSYKNPAHFIERVADAMHATLEEHAPRVEREFFIRMKREWDIGRRSLERIQIIGGYRAGN